MAKKVSAADDVPGIYQKRSPISLKIGSADAKARLRELSTRPPWNECFGKIVPWIQARQASENPDEVQLSKLALNRWELCQEKLQAEPGAEAQSLNKNRS